MAQTLRIRTHDELIALIPHRLGFHPRDSIVVMTLGQESLPTVRVDIPYTPADRDEMLDAVVRPYAAHAPAGTNVAIVCLSDEPADAERASRYLAAGLEDAGVNPALRLWANDDRWVDLDGGATGPRSTDAANRIDAAFVMGGVAGPAASRESMAASLVGDQKPVATALPEARDAARASDPMSERDWALGRLGTFQADGNRLDNTDAARMLLGIGSVKARDALWEDMSRDNAHTHVALWSDLTARAPDDVRTPAATMLAFSSWLSGDGAKAWCALDQIPDGQRSYPMAQLVAGVLQLGAHPDQWDQARASGPGSATTDRSSPGQRHERNNIPGQNQNRPGPAAPGR